MSELSKDVQRRIAIVVSGEPGALQTAAESLRARLSLIADLQLLPDQDQFVQTLIEKLLPYRFHLLTEDQQAFLMLPVPTPW